MSFKKTPKQIAKNESNKRILRYALAGGICVGGIFAFDIGKPLASGGKGSSGGGGTATSGGSGSSNSGGGGGGGDKIGSLKGVLPVSTDTTGYIVDALAAQRLGKALFWDIQAGSDGNACASCHFHSGADIRIRNQVNPGSRSVVTDTLFSPRAGTAGLTGPNKQLTAQDFPFHQLQQTAFRESTVTYDTNDVVSSQGTRAGEFLSNSPPPQTVTLTSNEMCDLRLDSSNPFHTTQVNRKVEPRNTPTVINAVYNYRQFWDGRANNTFNGNDPFGLRTNKASPNSGVLISATPGSLTLSKVAIANASLASQAVGPPLSDFEMSCAHKKFADLGNKLIPLQPLAKQKVHPADSMFGGTALLSGSAPVGLSTTYRDMIKKAFDRKFWGDEQTKVKVAADGTVSVDAAGYTQMEYNFSMFWGLAIQSYEALLISDDTPFDRDQMTKEAKDGQNVFSGKAKCNKCHAGPLMSKATVTSTSISSLQVVDRRVMNDGRPSMFDTGFFNIGSRSTVDDIGLGGTDGNGIDLSFTREYKRQLLGQTAKSADVFDPKPCRFDSVFETGCTTPPVGGLPENSPRDAVDGAFKTPILRNVGLTPPYFHNGGQANLKDVVRFYDRGGDRRGPLEQDTTGFGPTLFGQTIPTNLSPDMPDANDGSGKPGLGLSDKDMNNLVQFMLALTDERVACHSGVFDHPELPLANGQSTPSAGTQVSNDTVVTLPAVGKGGLVASGRECFPNTGDLFGSLNASDSRGLQDAFTRITR